MKGVPSLVGRDRMVWIKDALSQEPLGGMVCNPHGGRRRSYRPRAENQLPEVIEDVTFTSSVEVSSTSEQDAA